MSRFFEKDDRRNFCKKQISQTALNVCVLIDDVCVTILVTKGNNSLTLLPLIPFKNSTRGVLVT